MDKAPKKSTIPPAGDSQPARAQEKSGDDLTGIVGYVSTEGVKRLSRGKEMAEIRLEPESDKVVFRVKPEDIVEVRPGEVRGGYSLVHVILRPGAFVDTHIAMLRDVRNIQDPTIRRLTAAATVSVSSA